jgi:hypothetical protein
MANQGQATKRAMARGAKAMATAIMMADNKEGDGGGNNNGGR